MNKFFNNTEYIFWTMGTSMLGLHLGLVFSLNTLTLSMFIFMTIYASLLLMQAHMRKIIG
ncbi:MAG: hypothetical protein Phog2KO_32620 [Phototrophicaceae bacterium]